MKPIRPCLDSISLALRRKNNPNNPRDDLLHTHTNSHTHTRKRGGTTVFFFFAPVWRGDGGHTQNKSKPSDTQKNTQECVRRFTSLCMASRRRKDVAEEMLLETEGTSGKLGVSLPPPPPPPGGASVHFDRGKVCLVLQDPLQLVGAARLQSGICFTLLPTHFLDTSVSVLPASESGS